MLLFLISAGITVFILAALLILMLSGETEAVDARLMEIAIRRPANATTDSKTGLAGVAAILLCPLKPIRDLISGADDDMAFGVMREAHERRLSVPADLSECGYDDTPASQLITLSVLDAGSRTGFGFFNDGTLRARGLEGEVEVRSRQGLQLVGSYAICPTWADGHRTGYYSFALLRDRCPCPICTAARSAEPAAPVDPYRHGEHA